MCSFIYVTSAFFEDDWVLGTVLGAEGTTTDEDKPLYHGDYSLGWSGGNRH